MNFYVFAYTAWQVDATVSHYIYLKQHLRTNDSTVEENLNVQALLFYNMTYLNALIV